MLIINELVEGNCCVGEGRRLRRLGGAGAKQMDCLAPGSNDCASR